MVKHHTSPNFGVSLRNKHVRSRFTHSIYVYHVNCLGLKQHCGHSSSRVVARYNDGYDCEPDVERKEKLEPNFGIGI